MINLKNLINESNLSTIDKIYKNGEPRIEELQDKIWKLQQEKIKISKVYTKDIKKENLKVMKELENELKKLGKSVNYTKSIWAHTGAEVKVNGKAVRIRFTGPQGSKISGVNLGVKDVILKPNFKISDVAQRIAKIAE